MTDKSTEYLIEYWKSMTSLKKNTGPQSASFWDNMAEGYSKDNNKREKKISEVLELVKNAGIDINGAEIMVVS